jgi:hypothetical protein
VNKLKIDSKLVILVVGTFFLAYIFTFPTGWLISDEYSYLNRALAIVNGEKSLFYSDAITGLSIPYNTTSYPLGNSFWIALWIKVGGLDYAYMGSLFCVLMSTILIYKIIVKESYYKLSIVLLFVYPSLAFFSNSFMSSLPSLLGASLFVFILFKAKDDGKKWFLLSLIAAISFWIRETNLILLGSICLVNFLGDRRWLLYYVGGTMLGFLPRLISSYYYYNDPFYYVLGESFAFNHFASNISVYSILLIFFMPLGLFVIRAYRGRYFLSIQVASLLFILMYLFYSFNATAYSGYSKGLILMGRFMIPLLPFYIISVGWYFRDIECHKSLKFLDSLKFKLPISIVVASLIIIMQILVHKEAKLHKEISKYIYSNYSNKMVLFDLSRTTNVIRYINPFHGKMNYMSDISNINDTEFMTALFTKFESAYIIQTINSANADKREYTERIDNMIKESIEIYEVKEIDFVKIKPSLHLQILELNPNYGKEK